jgi:hypothetical protein
MKTPCRLILFVAWTASAWAQAPAFDPPSESQTISAQDLKMRLAGKSFVYRAPDSSLVSRVQYSTNGYAFLNVSTGFSDSGAWKAEDGKICNEWRRIPARCAEVRVKGDLLFVQNSNGVWGTLAPTE